MLTIIDNLIDTATLTNLRTWLSDVTFNDESPALLDRGLR